MNACLKLGSIVAALGMVALCAAPAPAAKGVKKTQEHHIRGKVVSIESVKGKKAPHVNLVIHMQQHKQKKGVAVVAKGTNKTFHLDTRTSVQNSKTAKLVGVNALRLGEHVTVFAHQHHADRVVIHPKKNKKLAKA